MALVNLSVDGRTHSIDVEPDMPLLYALRDELGLNNPRFGCGLAQCGACTVLMDGQPIRACVVPVAAATGEVQTRNGSGTEQLRLLDRNRSRLSDTGTDRTRQAVVVLYVPCPRLSRWTILVLDGHTGKLWNTANDRPDDPQRCRVRGRSAGRD